MHGGHDVPEHGCARIVVVGKGGVGKTTLTALLARQYARDGARVVAIDADEQRNLGATLGLDTATLTAVVPLAQAADYISEKTGARPGEGAGGMLRLNPDTSDVVDRLAVTGPDGVRLLVMGGVERAGGGCLCPENALLTAAIAGMRADAAEVVVMDTHAGVEHFGRALARGFDDAVVIVEPTYNAVQVGIDSARLARDLGIRNIHLVVNRVAGGDDVPRVLGHVAAIGGFAFTSVHSIPDDPRVRDTEPSVDGVLAGSPIDAAVAHLGAHLFEPATDRAAVL